MEVRLCINPLHALLSDSASAIRHKSQHVHAANASECQAVSVGFAAEGSLFPLSKHLPIRFASEQIHKAAAHMRYPTSQQLF